MNKIKIIVQGAIRLGPCVAVSFVVLFCACTSKEVFLTSTVVPAARGYVKINKDKQENYIIQVSLEHLAEAERLTPPKETYIIWMESDQNTTKNIGQINSSSNSNKLKATFETASSFQPTRIFISSEDDRAAAYPGSQIVLTTGRLKE